MKGGKHWAEAGRCYREAFELGLESNKPLKAIALNNSLCLKWWEFTEEVEGELEAVLSLSQNIRLSDEKAYSERQDHERRLEELRRQGKGVYQEIVRGFKTAMSLLECKEMIGCF